MSEPLKLLGLLADGKPHKSNQLTRLLSVDDETLKKLLEDLGALGVDWVEIPGQGYRWLDPVELLEPALILDGLGAEARSRLSDLQVVGEIDSTNRFLMDAARDGAGSGYACVAEYQSRGQGRRGRGFVSPIGNIYQSVLWRLDVEPSFLSGLSVAIGVLVAETCKRLGVAEVGVKWPNDVYWRARKLSGILVESLMDPTRGVAVVVGVGVNFRMAKEPGERIDQSWVDLHTASGRAPDRNIAVACLLEAILLGLDQFAQEGFAPFRSRWNQHDVMRNRAVVLYGSGDCTQGTAVGVDETGALLLDIDGVTQTVTSGDVSVRLQE